jgi:hypothetical protein
VEYLASDALRGRATPSPGLDSATAFIVRRLRQAGVRPLGDDGSYLQHYTVRTTVLDTSAAYLEIGGRRYRYGDAFIPNRSSPVSVTAEVVYVGHGLYAPAHGVDPYAGVEVRGRVLLVHGPGVLPPGIPGTRLTAEVTPPIWEAVRRGAVAVVYVLPDRLLANWERFRRSDPSRTELDPPVPSAYASTPIPSVFVRPEVAAALLAAEGIEPATLFPDGPTPTHPAAFALRTPLTLHVPPASEVVHRPANVVAVVEGRDPVLRNEYITLAAHLDGAVGTEPLGSDSIYNAADDNASGSAALLAMAEALQQGPRPRRSVVFLWDTGEEVGLWGTRWFVHAPPVPLDRIVAHLNIDMIGGTRAPGTAVPGEEELTGPNEVYLIGPRVLSAAADSLLAQANRSFLNLHFNRAYDDPASEFFYPRTDAGPFLERGVLTIGFFTGLHPRYHRPDDEAHFLDPAKMEAVARTAFVSAWLLADHPARVGIDKEIPRSVPRHR